MMKDKIWLEEVLNILKELYPNADTGLNFSSKFELLISTILSAQSTDKQVNKITSKLFKKFNTPEDFARLEPVELENEIRSCGLYRNKSRNIIKTSKIIQEKYEGNVPDNFDDLISLPGVGRKTANVVLSNAFNIPAFAVDTHVFRVSNRVGLVNGKNTLDTEKQLMEIIPKELWISTHHQLIYHGRQVCKSRNPECNLCRLNHLCKYQKTSQTT
ncbi:MAG TPA: endonuclease III [Thermoanaerobacterales bacterium]|nr:endonuclease III [Thermoanaerobacterales bacterium]